LKKQVQRGAKILKIFGESGLQPTFKKIKSLIKQNNIWFKPVKK